MKARASSGHTGSAPAPHDPLVQPWLSIKDSPAPIALFDADRRFVGATATWVQVCGLGKSQYVGRRLEEVIADVPAELLERHRQAAEGRHGVSEHESYV